MTAVGDVVEIKYVLQCTGRRTEWRKRAPRPLTVSLSPGTERLLRLKASSLGSEPGADRSISERLWSVREREVREGVGGTAEKQRGRFTFMDTV